MQINNHDHTVLVAKITIRMTVRDANVFILPLIFVNQSLLTSYAKYAYEKRKNRPLGIKRVPVL